MKRLAVLAAGVLAAAFIATAAEARPGYATGDVNMRTAPSVRAARITTIPAGARVEVHGCPSWCRVSFRGYTGWVSSRYIAGGYRRPAPRRYYYRPAPPPYWYAPRPYRRDYYRRHYYRPYRPGFGFYFGF